MAEGPVGAPAAGASAGAAPNSSTAATFKVNSSSLETLVTQWNRVQASIKGVNEELAKIGGNAEGVTKLTAALKGVGGGSKGSSPGTGLSGGSGGRMEGMPSAPSTTSTASATASASAHHAGGSGLGHGTPVLAGGARPFLKHPAVLAGAGVVAATGSYYQGRMGDISSADLFFNQQGQATGGTGYAGKDVSRQGMFNQQTGLTGYQSVGDALGGAQTLLGTVGGTTAAGSRGMRALQSTGSMAALNPDMGMQGSANAASNLYDPQVSARMRMMGMGSTIGQGGQLQSASSTYQNIINKVSGGKGLTANQVTEGLAQGAPLQATLQGLGLGPDAVAQFKQYGIAQAKFGGDQQKTQRAIDAAAKLQSGQRISASDRALVDKAGLNDSIRANQNKVGAAGARGTITAGAMGESGIEGGFSALAKTTQSLTDSFAALNKVTLGGSGTAAGLIGSAGSPLGSAIHSAGGITGAIYAAQTLKGGGFGKGALSTAGSGLAGRALGAMSMANATPVFVTNMPGGMFGGSGGMFGSGGGSFGSPASGGGGAGGSGGAGGGGGGYGYGGYGYGGNGGQPEGPMHGPERPPVGGRHRAPTRERTTWGGLGSKVKNGRLGSAASKIGGSKAGGLVSQYGGKALGGAAIGMTAYQMTAGLRTDTNGNPSVLGGAASGAATGAGALAMFGPEAALAGAVGGALIGGVSAEIQRSNNNGKLTAASNKAKFDEMNNLVSNWKSRGMNSVPAARTYYTGTITPLVNKANANDPKASQAAIDAINSGFSQYGKMAGGYGTTQFASNVTPGAAGPAAAAAPHRATGGLVPGSGVRDNTLINATPGELVVPTNVVARHGGGDSLMSKLGFEGKGGAQGHYSQGGVVAGVVTWPAMFATIKKQFPWALDNSDVRANDPGYHGVGEALDVGAAGNDPAKLMEADKWIAKNYPDSQELIHLGGTNIKNGKDVGDGFALYGATTMNEHGTHVHWARTSNPGSPSSPSAPGTTPAATGSTGSGAKATPGTTTPTSGGGGGGGIGADEQSALSSVLGAPALGGGGGAGTAAGHAAAPSSTGAPGAPGAAAAPATATGASGTTAPPPGGAVERWRSMVDEVLGELHLDTKLDNKVLTQIKTESSGNPNAIQGNIGDGNNASGDLAKGLMQVIGTTFNAWAGPYKSKGQLDPKASIYAGINYDMHKGGGNPNLSDLGLGHGYERGAWETGNETAKIHQGEMVVPKGPASIIRDAVRGRKQASLEHTPTNPGGTTSSGSRVVNVNINMGGVNLSGPATQDDAARLVRMVSQQAQDDKVFAALGRG